MGNDLTDEQASFGLPLAHHHRETCDAGRHDELPVRFVSGASSGMQDTSRKCMHRRFAPWTWLGCWEDTCTVGRRRCLLLGWAGPRRTTPNSFSYWVGELAAYARFSEAHKSKPSRPGRPDGWDETPCLMSEATTG